MSMVGEGLHMVQLTGAEQCLGYMLLPSSGSTIPLTGRWVNTIPTLKKGRLFIFVFDADTIRRHSWEEIVNSQMYLGKYSYNVAELDKMNWLIEYPPDTLP